jgi:hypothetical protein
MQKMWASQGKSKEKREPSSRQRKKSKNHRCLTLRLDVKRNIGKEIPPSTNHPESSKISLPANLAPKPSI